MIEAKESSPIFFEKKYVECIYSVNGHQIYYLANNNNDELLFLYKNSNYIFNYVESEIKIISDINSSIKDLEYDYDLGGYPLRIIRIKDCLYKITYGSFSNIGEFNDINNCYGKRIKANSVFLENSLYHLFEKFPNIELFDRIADLRDSNSTIIKNKIDDFNRRVNFFEKNKFLIFNQTNTIESKYFSEILKTIKSRNKGLYIYMNKKIFDINK
jgi:hypothetical protein